MATSPIMAQEEAATSVFQSDLPLDEKLDRARTELLDLSARNRLLNMPRSAKGTKAIEVVDEVSAEVFRLLVNEGRPFTFLAGKAAPGGEPVDGEAPVEDPEEVADLAQPEDDVADERGVFSRHADTRLQSRLTPRGLQKRLLELYFDARTLEEEQGVNILYLALGALKWIDPNNAANARFAPLVLVPAQLERGNAGEKFKLRMRQEDYASNLSLEAFLDRVHGIRLPAFEAGEVFDPVAYFDEVADAVSAKPGWEVQPDVIVLGFFSFAKFLMYRDLDPQTWPQGGRTSPYGARPRTSTALSSSSGQRTTAAGPPISRSSPASSPPTVDATATTSATASSACTSRSATPPSSVIEHDDCANSPPRSPIATTSISAPCSVTTCTTSTAAASTA